MWPSTGPSNNRINPSAGGGFGAESRSRSPAASYAERLGGPAAVARWAFGARSHSIGSKSKRACMEHLMKRTSIVAALLFSTASTVIAVAQSEGQRAAAEAERAVGQQDQERIDAQVAADTVALRRIYADDFLGIGPTGVVRNKSEVVADFTSHALTYQSITTGEVLVRVYGNTAVETGRSTMVGRDRGKMVPRDNRFTRVWVMKDGHWQLVANHYSLLTTP